MYIDVDWESPFSVSHTSDPELANRLVDYIVNGASIDEEFVDKICSNPELMQKSLKACLRHPEYPGSQLASGRFEEVSRALQEIRRGGNDTTMQKALASERKGYALWATEEAVLIRKYLKKHGSCANVSNIFYDKAGEKTSDFQQRVAKAREICKACPLLLPCLEYALIYDERHGLWAGSTENGRAVMIGRIEELVGQEFDQIRSQPADSKVRTEVRETLLPSLVASELEREVGTMTEERKV